MSSSYTFDLLITQSWQIAAVALGVWIIVRMFAADRPHLAHCLWALVLLKCLTPPIWSSPIGAFSWMESRFAHASGLQPYAAANSTRQQTPVIGEMPTLIVQLDSGENSSLPPALNPGSTRSKPISDSQRPVRTWPWRQAVVCVWLAGGVCSLFIALLRLALFWRFVTRHRQRSALAADSTNLPQAVCREDYASPPDIQQLTQRLAKKLRVGRRVNTSIVDARVGPAVFGLVQPTILLPAEIIRGRSLLEIEPLVAHELIHIRRGDLWWALLQTLATHLFWFHPLVWLADRMLTREAERSCDEETVAGLGCTPAAYARSLLDVLERKQRLRVAPALPGVRPVDVTRSRLERIMRLGHGCHLSTPGWVWAVFLLSLAVVLPGGAWLTAQEVTATPKSSADSEVPPTVVARSTGHWADRWKQSQFDVSDLLLALRVILGDDGQAEAELLSQIPRRTLEQINREAAEYGVSMSAAPDPQIDGHVLRIVETPEIIEQCRQTLAELRGIHCGQICLQLYTLTVPADRLDTLDIQWTEAETPAKSELTALRSSASTQVDYGLPPPAQPSSATPGDVLIMPTAPLEPLVAPETAVATYCSVIAPNKVVDLLNFAQQDPRSNLLQAPKITVFNGQAANVLDVVERPFVTRMESLKGDDGTIRAYQPRIQVAQSGWMLNFQARRGQDNAINLLLAHHERHVNEVELVFIKAENGQELVVQKPALENRAMRLKAVVPNGSCLLMSSRQRQPAPQAEMVTLILASCWIHGSQEHEAYLDSAKSVQVASTDTKYSPVQAPPVDLPNLVLRSDKPAKGTHHDALVQALQKIGDIQPEIQGDVGYSIDPQGTVQIDADLFTMENPNEYLYYGDAARIQFNPGESELNFHAEFKGHVRMQIEQIHATADQLILTQDRCEFSGNVTISSPDANAEQGADLSGESIVWHMHSGLWEVNGHGFFSRPQVDGPPLELHAEQFHWNARSNVLKALPEATEKK